MPAPPTSTTWSAPRPSVISRTAFDHSGTCLVVHKMIGAERLRARKLLVRRRGDDHLRARRLRELQREDRNAARALHDDGLARLQTALDDQRAPRGQRRARQRRRLGIAQIVGHLRHAFGRQQRHVAPHAVERSAERGRLRVARQFAGEPALEEHRRDAIADLHARHARPDGRRPRRTRPTAARAATCRTSRTPPMTVIRSR